MSLAANLKMRAHHCAPALLGTVLLLASCSMPGANLRQDVPSPQARALKLRVAFSSTAEFGDIPSLMAHELLVRQGYEVLPTFYDKPELAVEALARGDADIGNGSTRTYWAAVGKGAQIATIMDEQANAWQIVAGPAIRSCADLDGRRFSVSGEAAVSSTMAESYIRENCPGVKREIVLISGSPNRAAALLAGQIDATVLELADVIQLEQQAPGRTHSLVDFGTGLPHLKTTGVHVNRSFAVAHPEAVKDYIRALLTIHRQIRRDPDPLLAAAGKRLEIDEKLLPQISAAYSKSNSWDVNGGLSEEAVQYSLGFFSGKNSLPVALKVQDVADLSYLNAVLDEMGRQ